MKTAIDIESLFESAAQGARFFQFKQNFYENKTDKRPRFKNKSTVYASGKEKRQGIKKLLQVFKTKLA